MRIDLQSHTTASDGALVPADLVALAAAEDVDVLAITDHDTVDAISEARRAGARHGVRIVAGIELSALRDGVNVHVLGLFCDVEHFRLHEELAALRADRLRRARRIVQILNELGYPLRFEQVIEQTGGRVIARPHVARALVAAGLVPDVAAAFAPDLLADGGRADVRRRALDPVDALRIVHDAGGVAVLAHPGLAGGRGSAVPDVPERLVRDLTGAGLDGLEADHPDHPPHLRERLRELADELGLVATGGSDFHAAGERRLGSCTTSPEAFARLEALSRRA